MRNKTNARHSTRRNKNGPFSAILLLAAILAASSLTGCGAAKSVFPEQMIAETTAAASADMAAMAAGNAMDYAATETALEAEFGTGGDGNLIHAQPISSARKLIRNVNLAVETTEFDALLNQITEQVSVLGGYIEQSEISGSSISASQGSCRYAFLTARIPSDKLDGFLAQVDAAGNVTNRSGNVQDVTLQYTDIESRKKTLVVEQDRLWDLLARADSVDAVIALESRLSEIRYQLESLESQLRTYDNQVDYSTVCLSIDEVKVFTPTTPDSISTRIQKGFQRNLQGVSNSLINFFIWFVSSLPTLILLGVIVTIITVILRTIIRRQKPHTSKQRQLSKQVQVQAQPTAQSQPETPSPEAEQTPDVQPPKQQAASADFVSQKDQQQ